MYTETALFNFDPPHYNQAAPIASMQYQKGQLSKGFKEPSRAYEAITPRMIRSVVEEAGLGRFVYLQGRSGKRYVFSSIQPEQAPLYDNALFAVSEVGGDIVQMGERLDYLNRLDRLFYVHLLDDGGVTLQDVLADLGGNH